jgi:hypothetical protein
MFRFALPEYTQALCLLENQQANFWTSREYRRASAFPVKKVQFGHIRPLCRVYSVFQEKTKSSFTVKFSPQNRLFPKKNS